MAFRLIAAGVLALLAAGILVALNRDTASRFAILDRQLAALAERESARERFPGSPESSAELENRFDSLELRVSRLERADTPQPPHPPGGPAQLPLPEEALGALAMRIASVEQRLDALGAQVRLVAREGAGDSPRKRQTDRQIVASGQRETSRARKASAQEQRLLELASRHAGEVRDAHWADVVETSLRSQILASPSLSSHVALQGVDCRTSLCRVTWNFEEGLSSLQYFELENEMAAALGIAGLRHGTLTGSALNPGGTEGYFFRPLDDAPDPRKRESPAPRR